MKKFCFKCGLFFLPLVLFFVPAVYHLQSFRELESVVDMAESNQEGELIGLAYTDPMHLVKHSILEERQPEIIALGTSRVLSFRDFFFDEPDHFYNCGRSVGKVQDMKSFLMSYPGKKPKILLLSLDQDFFGIDDEDIERPPRSYVSEKTSYGTRLIKGTKALIDALKEGEVESGEVIPEAESYIGRNAQLYSEGYRPDGSYLYGRRLRGEKEKGDYSFENTINRIDKRQRRFAAADRIHQGAINELEDFIKLCDIHEIHVVAFFPPYANKVYRRFGEEPHEFPHVFGLYVALEPIFREHGFTLFDFSDLKSLGSNDYETYDGFHASETAYLKLLRIMAKKDSKLENYVNMEAAEKMLKNLFSARQVILEFEETHPERPASNGE